MLTLGNATPPSNGSMTRLIFEERNSEIDACQFLRTLFPKKLFFKETYVHSSLLGNQFFRPGKHRESVQCVFLWMHSQTQKNTPYYSRSSVGDDDTRAHVAIYI